MTWAIPTGLTPVIQRDDRGIAVWSLQKALNNLPDPDIAADGDFGPLTEKRVKAYQSSTNLFVDGIAGPATQRALATMVINAGLPGARSVPLGLLNGFAESEGGWLLAATNWSIPGGVDCGLFQRRVYDGQKDDAHVEDAFNTKAQAIKVIETSIEQKVIYLPRRGTQDRHNNMPPDEKAWRLAAGYHNYPAGVDRLSRTPIVELSTYWTSPQDWVTSTGYRFPNGRLLRSPLDWLHMYCGILGRGVFDTNGLVTKYVVTFPS